MIETDETTDQGTVMAVEEEFATLDAPGVDDEQIAILHRFVRYNLRLDEEAERVKGQFAAILRDLDNRRKAAEFRFGMVARVTADRLIKVQGGRLKSIKTPWGTVGFRKTVDRVDVADEQAVIDWASTKSKADWIKTKYVLVKSKVTEYVKGTGELPPGCDLVPGGETFYVKGPRKVGDSEVPDEE